MILEMERMITDWLDDATYGVNAQIDTLDLDAGDSDPPDIKIIEDITRSARVALRQDPSNYPAIYVMADGGFEMEGEVMTNAGPRRSLNLPVAIRYLVQKADLDKGHRDTRYTLRAIVKSLKALTEADQTTRTRNSICLERIESVTHELVFEEVGESVVTGAVVVTLFVRDGQT